ncbi:OmpP1/FadL family transporter [Ancylomarina longa]|uniref:Transporter n=1 Tax=Ancylomarina longa TaxID=2487017 RepID=A0A434AYQ1_9BACT|nr:outer membrane protein transport protein [Ancylomarina longa]RUT79680.1 hypothetical protein DLK05_03050 [Ancylomarina longa]
MKRYYFILIGLLISGITSAQSVDDVLRYSRQNYSGTARSTAMGGAFGALGGDFSSLSINPAGIAVYRTSEFTFTPSVEYTKSTNSGYSENKTSFAIGNVGFVSTYIPRLAPEKGWQNINFGIGYNRVANFNRQGFLFNLDSPGSLLDHWADMANGTAPDDLYVFEDKLAYDNYLINPDDNLFYQSVLFDGDRMDQQKYIDEKGYIGEYLLSFGANYSHKLYIGATLGIQDVYYKSTTTYMESSVPGNITSLQDFIFREYLRTSGVGVNFKLGIIYKPTQNLRLGLALHTPTYYSLDDRYDTFVDSQFDTANANGFPEDGEAYHGFNSEAVSRVSYKLQTTARAIFSGAYTFGKKGVISADLELVDYSSAEFDDNSNGDYTNTNQEISNSYQSTANIRVGGEYRVAPNFSLRAGYAHIGNPYNTQINESYNTYSGGFGFKQNNFFFDMAYQYKQYDENFVLYPTSPDNVTLNNKNHQVRMTFGFKF